MVILLVILIFCLSSQAFSAEAERGVVIGAKCDEIRKIEFDLDSQELTKDKTQMEEEQVFYFEDNYLYQEVKDTFFSRDYFIKQ